MLSTRSIQLEQDITTARRGSAATDHLGTFVPNTYAIFLRTQLLVHIPPLTEFDPFTEAKELDGVQDAAPVQNVQGMLETHLMSPYRISPPSCIHVSIDDYNEVFHLYEAKHLKLAMVRLSNEHRASMAPPAGRGQGTQHGGNASRGTRRMPVISEQAEKSSSDDLEETASNIS
ncbi:hypothetical protein JCGZ_03137 [Jatropha curcas]|uniref:Uncharacterized protein n=1 Tax=Jatropha curcas TaxID=180498 RepID=A0A067JDR1_JATCU|nr:hypothetical protein JCGZ_03137 [Jatropha curcas]